MIRKLLTINVKKKISLLKSKLHTFRCGSALFYETKNKIITINVIHSRKSEIPILETFK